MAKKVLVSASNSLNVNSFPNKADVNLWRKLSPEVFYFMPVSKYFTLIHNQLFYIWFVFIFI